MAKVIDDETRREDEERRRAGEGGRDEEESGTPPPAELPTSEIEQEDRELIAEAIGIIGETRNASISYLQRRLKIGYNRAVRIIKTLEQRGLVGPQVGTKPREVFIDRPQPPSGEAEPEEPIRVPRGFEGVTVDIPRLDILKELAPRYIYRILQRRGFDPLDADKLVEQALRERRDLPDYFEEGHRLFLKFDDQGRLIEFQYTPAEATSSAAEAGGGMPVKGGGPGELSPEQRPGEIGEGGAPPPPEGSKPPERDEEKESKDRNGAFGAVTKIAYSTAGSVFGFKFIGDLLAATRKKGDFYEYFKDRSDKKAIKKAFEDLATSTRVISLQQRLEKETGRDAIEETHKEEFTRTIEAYRQKIENANISEEKRRELYEQFRKIIEDQRRKYEDAIEVVPGKLIVGDAFRRELARERDEKAKAVLNNFIQTKAKGIRIAKDFLNTALVVSGQGALRGIMYGLTAAAERGAKAYDSFSKEQQEGAVGRGRGERLKYITRDLCVTAGRETIDGFVGGARLLKKGEKDKKQKALKATRSFGVLFRGIGIGIGAGRAFSEEGVLNEEVWEKVLDKIERDGWVKGLGGTATENFITNARRILFLDRAEPEDTGEPGIEREPGHWKYHREQYLREVRGLSDDEIAKRLAKFEQVSDTVLKNPEGERLSLSELLTRYHQEQEQLPADKITGRVEALESRFPTAGNHSGNVLLDRRGNVLGLYQWPNTSWGENTYFMVEDTPIIIPEDFKGFSFDRHADSPGRFERVIYTNLRDGGVSADDARALRNLASEKLEPFESNLQNGEPLEVTVNDRGIIEDIHVVEMPRPETFIVGEQMETTDLAEALHLAYASTGDISESSANAFMRMQLDNPVLKDIEEVLPGDKIEFGDNGEVIGFIPAKIPLPEGFEGFTTEMDVKSEEGLRSVLATQFKTRGVSPEGTRRLIDRIVERMSPDFSSGSVAYECTVGADGTLSRWEIMPPPSAELVGPPEELVGPPPEVRPAEAVVEEPPAPAAEAAEAPAPAEALAPVEDGGTPEYFVSIADFARDEDKATKGLGELIDSGFDGVLVTTESEGGGLSHEIRLGPFESLEDARRAEQLVERSHKFNQVEVGVGEAEEVIEPPDKPPAGVAAEPPPTPSEESVTAEIAEPTPAPAEAVAEAPAPAPEATEEVKPPPPEVRSAEAPPVEEAVPAAVEAPAQTVKIKEGEGISQALERHYGQSMGKEEAHAKMLAQLDSHPELKKMDLVHSGDEIRLDGDNNITEFKTASEVKAEAARAAVPAPEAAEAVAAEAAEVPVKNEVLIQKGEGLSQALKRHYIEVMGEEESVAQAHMLKELQKHNSPLYKDEQLQDWVHPDDKMILDDKGSVTGFEPANADVPAERLPEVLDVSGEHAVKLGDNVVELPEGATAEMVENPYDQHNNLVITDTAGEQHRIIDYDGGKNVFVDGEERDFQEWLGGLTPEKPQTFEEFMQAVDPETQREAQVALDKEVQRIFSHRPKKFLGVLNRDRIESEWGLVKDVNAVNAIKEQWQLKFKKPDDVTIRNLQQVHGRLIDAKKAIGEPFEGEKVSQFLLRFEASGLLQNLMDRYKNPIEI